MLHGHGIMTIGAERMAAREASCSQPAAANETESRHCLGRIVGARGEEAARSSKIWGYKEFVGSEHGQSGTNTH